jgi:2-dehydro-3-deoxyphosphogluconate aldolase/(4S)-4-hydroxy-2-oxoglutarate aldolase
LHRQPVLAVLRPSGVDEARAQLLQLQQLGLLHVELAVGLEPHWVAMVRRLVQEFPGLRLGGASVRCASGLEAVAQAGLGYAVSPILERSLMERAEALALPLVPGVFSPTEVAAAVRWGARAVKLYPAMALPRGYWASLRGPLGPLPFCIAAGGLTPPDGAPWLQAGVDAIALGGQLFSATAEGPQLHPELAPLLAWLRSRADD